MPCSNCCRAKSYDKTKQLSGKKDKPLSDKKCKHEVDAEQLAKKTKKAAEQAVAAASELIDSGVENDGGKTSVALVGSGVKLESSKPKKKSSKYSIFVYL
jgi:hypothetical protein